MTRKRLRQNSNPSMLVSMVINGLPQDSLCPQGVDSLVGRSDREVQRQVIVAQYRCYEQAFPRCGGVKRTGLETGGQVEGNEQRLRGQQIRGCAFWS